MISFFAKKRVYLDYAAATPLLPAARVAMMPFLGSDFGNASAIHTEGQRARHAVDGARECTARALGIRPEYVTFTSGGTEANNLAIIGALEHLRSQGLSLVGMEVVTTLIEHPSVAKAMSALEAQGVIVKYVPVDASGLVQVSELTNLLSPRVVLFSCAYANSEIGTVQKVRAIKKALRTAEEKYGTIILFHLDAAQAPLWLPCQLETVSADLLTLDAGKCHGPKGVGVLARSRRANIQPVSYGGGQEGGLRPGTEHVASIVGAAVAIADAQAAFRTRAAQVMLVRDAAISHLSQAVETLVLNGAVGEDRLANNINISIPGLDTEYATVVLDTQGFAVSTKSACAGAGGGESHVVRTISHDTVRAQSTLRISLSPKTTVQDIVRLTAVLQAHIKNMATVKT